MNDRTCSVEGCEKPHFGRGWCQMHHARVRARGTTAPVERSARPVRACTVLECSKPILAKNLCAMHYARVRSTGSLELAARPNAEDRFFAKVVERGECWEWTGSTDDNGYGKFNPGQKAPVNTHRWVYEFMVAEIPEGLHIDHLCRNRSCVNPSHLDPVTPAENARRGRLQHVCKACCPIETKHRREQRRLIADLRQEIRRLSEV